MKKKWGKKRWERFGWSMLTGMSLFYFGTGLFAMVVSLLTGCTGCLMIYQGAFLVLIGVCMMNAIAVAKISERLRGLDKHNRKDKAL